MSDPYSLAYTGPQIDARLTLANTATQPGDAVDTLSETATAKIMTDAERTKLATVAAGAEVTLATAQTLTNKTIAFANNTLTGVQPSLVSGTSIKTINGNSLLGSGNLAVGDVTLFTAQTLSAKTFANYTESVFVLMGTVPDIKPFNGPIQTWTLTANSTPTASDWASGQSLTLLVDDGAAHTITWTSLGVVWVTGGGTAPELNIEGYTHLTFWKVGTTIYGARVGDA